MRVPDSTLVVSAIFQMAEKGDPQKIAPGQVTSFLTENYGLNLPLHTVSEIISNLGISTHTVGNTRYLVWDDKRMSSIRNAAFGNPE